MKVLEIYITRGLSDAVKQCCGNFVHPLRARPGMLTVSKRIKQLLVAVLASLQDRSFLDTTPICNNAIKLRTCRVMSSAPA